jgi:hypothetical protein
MIKGSGVSTQFLSTAPTPDYLNNMACGAGAAWPIYAAVPPAYAYDAAGNVVFPASLALGDNCGSSTDPRASQVAPWTGLVVYAGGDPPPPQ